MRAKRLAVHRHAELLHRFGHVRGEMRCPVRLERAHADAVFRIETMTVRNMSDFSLMFSI